MRRQYYRRWPFVGIGLQHKFPSEYGTWAAMKTRCTNSKGRGYHNYGGRGITLCDRWLYFDAFISDMGPRPTKAHRLGRKNVNLGYTPDNCLWVTHREQNRNRRNNHYISFGGKCQCLTAWVEELGLPCRTVRERLRQGWSIERALTTPKGSWTRRA